MHNLTRLFAIWIWADVSDLQRMARVIGVNFGQHAPGQWLHFLTRIYRRVRTRTPAETVAVKLLANFAVWKSPSAYHTGFCFLLIYKLCWDLCRRVDKPGQQIALMIGVLTRKSIGTEVSKPSVLESTQKIGRTYMGASGGLIESRFSWKLWELIKATLRNN